MALTNFAALTDEQLTIWQRKVWRAAREKMFISKFLGTDENAMIHRITELTKSDKGARAVITLITDLEDDGVAGDRFLEGNEEAMNSDDQVIQIDQLRHAIRHKGRMADQRSVVKFRENAMGNLSYWHANRWDQMAFLALSGVSFAMTNNGAPRPKQELAHLGFASDITAPSANRHYRWNGTAGTLDAGDTTAITAADVVTYDMLVDMRTKAEENYLRPLRESAGVEWYNVFMHPRQIAQLKKDDDFKKAYRNALERSPNNPLFKGTDVIWLDGLAIHKHRYVFNTTGAAAGSKWGAAGAINGGRILFCGAQALAMADLGPAYWDEKKFDYNNQPGIAVGKIAGLLKPQFYSIYNQSVEDFGVMAIDTAL